MTSCLGHDDVGSARSRLVFTSTGDVVFALRTTLAGIAALFTAMWLQLNDPRWAMYTVFIVSPPLRGNTLRKTAARLVGTVIGCIVGIAIVGFFPQDRLGFYLVFAAWLSACAYWATLRRGYISYAASLAAFTCAIVAADGASAPLQTWQVAVARGSATVLGTLFAFLASELSARSDDVPRDLADRVRLAASNVLDWAVMQLQPHQSNRPKDAPFTDQILGLDETCTNAIAERPALGWVKPWVVGLPTALLSLQSAVLRLGNAAGRGLRTIANVQLKDALEAVAVSLRSTARFDLASLRREISSLESLQARNAALNEIVEALLYLICALEAILTLRPPTRAPPLYPKPKFDAHPRYAMTNALRTVVGILAGFMIWDITAWSHGDVFMINVAVGLVIFVALDDPVAGNRPNLFGNLIGGVVALAAKYLVLVHANDALSLLIVLFPLLFIGAWAETKPALASLGLFYVNGLQVVTQPSNPQRYDFVNDINVLIALVFAYAFVPMIFVAVGAPRRGAERIAELLTNMRRHRQSLVPDSTREQRLARETQMYDEFRRLQAVTNDPRYRESAVNLLLTAD